VESKLKETHVAPQIVRRLCLLEAAAGAADRRSPVQKQFRREPRRIFIREVRIYYNDSRAFLKWEAVAP